jgi:hypothetical protein
MVLSVLKADGPGGVLYLAKRMRSKTGIVLATDSTLVQEQHPNCSDPNDAQKVALSMRKRDSKHLEKTALASKGGKSANFDETKEDEQSDQRVQDVEETLVIKVYTTPEEKSLFHNEYQGY